MIAATIGKMFLNAYNKKYGSNYDAQSFFVEKFILCSLEKKRGCFLQETLL